MGGNQYKESVTYEKSKKLLEKLLVMSEDKKYDFIGEVCKDAKTYRHEVIYITDKFPELRHLMNKIKSNCEANCFLNGKKGKINTAMSIVNLKSNHGWTDRAENNVNFKGEMLNYTDDERDARIKELLSKKDAD